LADISENQRAVDGTVSSEPVGSPDQRRAENILVRVKQQDGTTVDVPILMLLADLFNQVADLKLRLTVVEADQVKKSPIIKV